MRSLNYGWTRASTRTGVICSGRTELLVVLLCQSHQKCFASGQALQPISSNHALCWILQVSPNICSGLCCSCGALWRPSRCLWCYRKMIGIPEALLSWICCQTADWQRLGTRLGTGAGEQGGLPTSRLDPLPPLSGWQILWVEIFSGSDLD